MVDAGDAPRKPTKVDVSRRGVLQREYEAYLREQRGLAETTIYACTRYAEWFPTFKFGKRLGDLKRIRTEDITAYILRRGKSKKRFKDKRIATHLRAFFRFLDWADHTDQNLAESIPSSRQVKPRQMPRYLPPDDVNRLIDAARLSKKTGRRDHAILMMMTRLGLRAPQSYVGSHVLRHGLATELLRNGASIEDIGDALRHRSKTTTAIYAQHDLDSLRSLSKPWPTHGRAS